MGYRTVVILENDHLNEVAKLNNFGDTISKAAGKFSLTQTEQRIGHYGVVVEQAHVDSTKLVIIGLNGMIDLTEVASTYGSNPASELELLAQFADKLGYVLVHKDQV